MALACARRFVPLVPFLEVSALATSTHFVSRSATALLFFAASALGMQAPQSDSLSPASDVYEDDSGAIVASDATGTFVFDDWGAYLNSEFFVRNGRRCAAVSRTNSVGAPPEFVPSDCTQTFTNPAAIYDPSNGIYTIPVVVHVLIHSNGNGNISDAMIQSQIAVLNEDFMALTGTLGSNGTYSAIQFALATTTPTGGASTGITRTVNSTWYNDGGTYYNSLAWDTNRYLNIYTNTAGGNLGYAYMPNQGGVVGQAWDGVRILYSAFGRNSPYVPYNLGRTATHEVGHYIGLHHTFEGGCATGNCYQVGDRICDTNNEQSPNYSGCSRSTCSSSDPVKNYMDYSADACMDNFTPEQARRMRCTLESYRPLGYSVSGGGTLPGAASSPSPANTASNVSTTASLSWGAGSGASGYDVYFGVDSTPDSSEYQGNQGGLSFNPGALAVSTTYYWRIDSVNGYGTTTGAVWSFTTGAGSPPPGGPLLVDGFESGGANWFVTAGTPAISTAAKYTGSYGARIPKTSGMVTYINATGRTNISLKYARRTSGLDSSENLYVEWSANGGSSWLPLETTKQTSWATKTWSLGAAANNNPNIHIRFRTNANGNNERADIDDVLVSAN
jgi:hypothetical protein